MAIGRCNVRIHHNVISRSLSAISLAGEKAEGNYFIFRNLIDLRQPIAGNRPRKAEDTTRAMRYGHLYKSTLPDGPWELFQNTLLVSAQREERSTPPSPTSPTSAIGVPPPGR